MSDFIIRKYLSFFLLLICMIAVGCQDGSTTLPTEYGKIYGIEGGTSVNGTSVFNDMFEERGFKSRRSFKISPKIEKYQTLVWFPDDRSCPSPEAVDAINEWLLNGWDRTFIYVGRDYNAHADYLDDVFDSAPPESQEELLRQMAETDLKHDETDDDVWWNEDLPSCDWFDRVANPRSKSQSLKGPMVSGLSDQAEIELSTTLEANGDWREEALLTAGETNFVFKLTEPGNDYADAKIIVVNNGSFLVNYALVDPDNRILAGELIDECDPSGDVMFLESGQSGVTVSDTDTNNTNPWAWIAEAPLRYIVPHFLMWGILFCFVYFPIFGRPREGKQKSTTTFRNHVIALGKMIGRSDLPNRAVNKIRKYHETVGDTKRKKD